MNRRCVASAVTVGLVLISCTGDDSVTQERTMPPTAEEPVQGSVEAEDLAGTDKTKALSAVRLQQSQLVAEIPVGTPQYLVTAELPPGWISIASADADDANLDSEAWELASEQAGALTMEIYDTRGTSYEVEAVPISGEEDVEGWDALYRFTGATFGPPQGMIGSTEEVEVPEHRPGFDLLMVNPGPDGTPEEASKLVVSLNGSYYVTFTTPFGLDKVDEGVVGDAYTKILDTVTVASPATVTVDIRQLVGAEDHHLAGVLYLGNDWRKPQGGFAVDVNADPYSSPQLVRVGYDEDHFPSDQICTAVPQPANCIAFPYVTDQVLYVAPGPYVLQLWLSPVELRPYNHWVPVRAVGLAACIVNVEVTAPDTTVTVTGIPAADVNSNSPCSST